MLTWNGSSPFELLIPSGIDPDYARLYRESSRALYAGRGDDNAEFVYPGVGEPALRSLDCPSHADALLQYLKNCEEVDSVRVAVRTEHAMQALAGLLKVGCQLFEPMVALITSRSIAFPVTWTPPG